MKLEYEENARKGVREKERESEKKEGAQFNKDRANREPFERVQVELALLLQRKRTKEILEKWPK